MTPATIIRAVMTACCASLLVAGTVLAGAAATTVTVQIAEAAQRFSVTGSVESVDYASNSVTIKSGGQGITVMVTPTTVIEQHGETGSMSDIRKGVKLTASGVIQNGKRIASSIVLK